MLDLSIDSQGTGGVDYYVTPTFPLGRKPFRMACDAARQSKAGTINKAERLIDWIWDAETQYRTAVDPGDVVGETMESGLVIDEAGRMPAEAFDYIEPMTRVNDAVQIRLGTPRGKGSRFYDDYLRGLDADGLSPLLTDKPPADARYVSIKVPSISVPWWTPDALAEARASMSPGMYRQEIDAEFLDGAATVFEGFEAICTGAPEKPYKDAVYAIGADLGKLEDYTALRVFRVDCSPVKEVRQLRFQGDWTVQKQRVAGLAKEYNRAIVVIDATGVGEPVADELAAMGVNLSRFKFTGPSKQALVENLVAKVQTSQLRLLAREHDPVGYQEMADFAYEIINPRGRSVVDGQSIRYGHAPGKHDDTVMARALALQALGRMVVGVPIA